MTQQKSTRRGNTQEIVNKKGHSRISLSGIFNACRCKIAEKTLFNKHVEDPRLQISGMTPNLIPPHPAFGHPLPLGARGTARGFTLIELLVVVLIIGLLAAVALPQYQKAVRKARVAEAKVILKKLTDAQDVYFLSHTEGPDDKSIDGWNEVLDLEFPFDTKNWGFYTEDCTNENGKIGCANNAIPRFEEAAYSIYYSSSNYEGGTLDISGRFTCTDDEGICKGLGGVQSEDYGNNYILP